MVVGAVGRYAARMPVYVYQEVLEDGSDGEVFEVVQSMQDEPFRTNPVTGRPVRRIYQAPNISAQHTRGGAAAALDNANVARKGFTKYEKDKLTGRYHRVAGRQGPSVIDPRSNA